MVILTKGAGSMKKYRHHSIEYKRQILAEIDNGIRTKAAVCREEDLACSLVDKWQRQAREGTLRDIPTVREREQARELDWYKKKVAELTREIDLLKKIDEYSARMRRSNGSVVTGLSTESRRGVQS
jgi:transposase-like protein